MKAQDAERHQPAHENDTNTLSLTCRKDFSPVSKNFIPEPKSVRRRFWISWQDAR